MCQTPAWVARLLMRQPAHRHRRRRHPVGGRDPTRRHAAEEAVDDAAGAEDAVGDGSWSAIRETTPASGAARAQLGPRQMILALVVFPQSAEDQVEVVGEFGGTPSVAGGGGFDQVDQERISRRKTRCRTSRPLVMTDLTHIALAVQRGPAATPDTRRAPGLTPLDVRGARAPRRWRRVAPDRRGWPGGGRARTGSAPCARPPDPLRPSARCPRPRGAADRPAPPRPLSTVGAPGPRSRSTRACQQAQRS